MEKQHITLARNIKAKDGSNHCLYYYFGNFYYPMDLPIKQASRVKFLINKFRKENAAMVEKDRSQPDYKTLIQLFDQGENHGTQ